MTSRAVGAAREVVAETRALTKLYSQGAAQVRAVDGINLRLERGSFTAIMGPSGSGKSTLMHCMAGLDRPTQGNVLLAGRDLSLLSDKELTNVRRDQIGFIFQQFNLLPTLTARQNILLPLELAGKKVDKQQFDAIVESLGLTDRLKHLPSELSGGQQQRVAITRALITQPEVVFADEPTGALDSRSGHKLLNYLAECSRDWNQTIVMVTHDPTAAAYADRALILSDGRIVEDIPNPDVDSTLNALRRLDGHHEPIVRRSPAPQVSDDRFFRDDPPGAPRSPITAHGSGRPDDTRVGTGGWQPAAAPLHDTRSTGGWQSGDTRLQPSDPPPAAADAWSSPAATHDGATHHWATPQPAAERTDTWSAPQPREMRGQDGGDWSTTGAGGYHADATGGWSAPTQPGPHQGTPRRSGPEVWETRADPGPDNWSAPARRSADEPEVRRAPAAPSGSWEDRARAAAAPSWDSPRSRATDSRAANERPVWGGEAPPPVSGSRDRQSWETPAAPSSSWRPSQPQTSAPPAWDDGRSTASASGWDSGATDRWDSQDSASTWGSAPSAGRHASPAAPEPEPTWDSWNSRREPDPAPSWGGASTPRRSASTWSPTDAPASMPSPGRRAAEAEGLDWRTRADAAAAGRLTQPEPRWGEQWGGDETSWPHARGQ